MSWLNVLMAAAVAAIFQFYLPIVAALIVVLVVARAVQVWLSQRRKRAAVRAAIAQGWAEADALMAQRAVLSATVAGGIPEQREASE